MIESSGGGEGGEVEVDGCAVIAVLVQIVLLGNFIRSTTYFVRIKDTTATYIQHSGWGRSYCTTSVSYTHLTLPTKRIV